MEAAACRLPPAWPRLPATGAGPAQRLERGGRDLPLWRPWLPRDEEASGQLMDTARPHGVTGDGRPENATGDKALALFHHPVRSKSFDYLYSVGEKLLENFPVQATLSLYDDSDSEEEEEEEDDDDDDEEEAVRSREAGSPRQAARAV
ncbi:protein ripply1 [Apteryx mantelli]|uniref:Protein ripply1 n=1 Tax=Apteryx mantelli TaxID=2696672 RepID=A0ABM4F6F8_9AVES